MRRARRSTAGEVRFEMTPLIDVVFLLLTFFIFALMVMVKADTLDIELPTLSAAGQASRGETITVTLTSTGEIRVDGQPIPVLPEPAVPPDPADPAQPTPTPLWVQAVQAAQEQRPDAAIVLIADERGRVGDLVGLFNGLREAGINARVGLLSRPAE
jgi:biopolymer transport protein ExbD